MIINTYGRATQPTILLLHGMLTPLAVFEPIIQHLSQGYFVIAPILDGHDGHPEITFESAEQQAETIISYLKAEGISHLHAAIGFSLGGVVAFAIWQSWTGKLDRLLLDGAPLSGYGRLLAHIMTDNYLSIVTSSRKRDSKTRRNFEKHFLPRVFWHDYLVIADSISSASVRNMINTTAVNRLKLPLKNDGTVVTFLHGTAINELVSRRSAKRLQALCPQTRVHCFRGDAHCRKAIFEPQKWIDAAVEYLD